jgi:hypothetical protein
MINEGSPWYGTGRSRKWSSRTGAADQIAGDLGQALHDAVDWLRETEAFAISGRRRGSLLPQDLMVFSWPGYVPELGLRLQDDFRLHSETALDC